jgi:cell division protein FtsB
MLQKFRFFIIIFLLFLFFLPGFAKLQELRQRLSDAEDKIRKTQRENAILEDEIAQLRSNQEYLEMVAREKMGVVKKGETVLKFIQEDEAGNTAANQTAASLKQ